MSRLFVYGDLLQGRPLDGVLAPFRRRPARVRGRLVRLPGGGPGLVPDEAEAAGEVAGELVDLPESFLSVVDLMLGVREGELERVRLSVAGRRGSLTAWTHVVPPATARYLAPLRVRDWRRAPTRGR